MFVELKIALRNVLNNKKRSILHGSIILVVSLLLFFSDSAMNGVYNQSLRGYLYLQSGHVAVEWESTRKIGDMSAAKFLIDSSFDSDNKSDNKEAVRKLKEYVTNNNENIEHVFYSIRKNAILKNDDKNNESIILYGLNAENKDMIISTKTLSMAEGQMLSDNKNGICISMSMAEDHNYKIGDKISLELYAKDKSQIKCEFEITGIYNNGAGYDNLYGFINHDRLKELVKYEDDEFDLCRIYLKDLKDSETVASDINKYIGDCNDVLKAEDYNTASVFYTSISKNLKFFFVVFTAFLLIMIGLGMQSTLKLNLFQRLREFGTLRAIGYNKKRCFFIVFLEVAVLSFVVWAVSTIIGFIIVLLININGIYLGSGTISYTLGGEYLFFDVKIIDIIKSFIIVMLFSLCATLAPGISICKRNIVDALSNR